MNPPLRGVRGVPIHLILSLFPLPFLPLAPSAFIAPDLHIMYDMPWHVESFFSPHLALFKSKKLSLKSTGLISIVEFFRFPKVAKPTPIIFSNLDMTVIINFYRKLVAKNLAQQKLQEKHEQIYNSFHNRRYSSIG
jgi:hypothetical protein